MLVQPLQAATVCEFDLVQHAIRSWKRAQTLDPRQPPDNCHEPLNRTLDGEHAHVSSHSPDRDLRGPPISKWALQVWTPFPTTRGCLLSHRQISGSDRLFL